jgi:AcrR family transcriptional regulator
MVSTEPPPLSIRAMTSRQLVRRAKLIEAVIELVREVGPGAVQMRDVADRSGIALGTLYRYFSSKEHLLAEALCEWQERLTRRVLTNNRPDPADSDDPTAQMLSYVRKELRGFARNPELAALMVQMHVSSDRYACEALERMSISNGQVMYRLLADVPPDRARPIVFALGAILMTCLTDWVTGRTSLAEMTDTVESAAGIILKAAAA